MTNDDQLIAFQSAVAGRYSLEGEIGRGGMGIVFSAREVALDRQVAIKLLPPQQADRSGLRQRFLTEARTAARLSHPNIVPIYAVEEIGEFVFFVMALVPGETLAERLARRGPLSPNNAIRLFREVAWALSYAHGQGVVHRDVKPDNILIEDMTERALVMDFGIAQASHVNSTSQTGEVLGTPEFMSPEQAMGESVDARADLYSLGVTAFYALTGRLPFEAESSPELLAHHIRTPPPSLNAIAPGVPRRLSRAVHHCLAKEPEERIQSGQELAEALSHAEEVKTEAPVAVRAFLTTARQSQAATGVFYLLFFMWIAPFVLGMFFMSASLLWRLPLLAIFAGMSFVPVTFSVFRVRRLMKAGFGRADLIAALDTSAAKRNEELAFLYGADHAERAKAYRRAAAIAAVAGVASYGIALAGLPWFLLVGTGAWIACVIASHGARKRGDSKLHWSRKFWKGRLGRWLFKISGRGIKPPARTVPATNRPTEIAIGMAVTSLYESLPEPTRASLGDLPDVVHGLERDAQRMRAKVEEMNDLLAHTHPAERDSTRARDDSLAGQRYRATERIRELRDRATRRLAETVAALENLRVDLLRMRAGTVNLESVTANLGSARELADHVDRLLQGHAEIEQELEATG